MAKSKSRNKKTLVTSKRRVSTGLRAAKTTLTSPKRVRASKKSKLLPKSKVRGRRFTDSEPFYKQSGNKWDKIRIFNVNTTPKWRTKEKTLDFVKEKLSQLIKKTSRLRGSRYEAHAYYRIRCLTTDGDIVDADGSTHTIVGKKDNIIPFFESNFLERSKENYRQVYGYAVKNVNLRIVSFVKKRGTLKTTKKRRSR